MGIIYGARLSKGEKKRVQEILKDRKEWSYKLQQKFGVEFDFMKFEAVLSTNERSLKIEPFAISTYERIYILN